MKLMTTAFLPEVRKDVLKMLFIMKLTVVFLLAFLQVGAKGFTQSVTLSEKNAQLQKIFREINKQTGYHFFYKDQLLKKAGKINVELKNVSIEEALNACFKDLSITYTIVDKAIVIKEKKQEPVRQNETSALSPLLITVKGLVKDEKGMPLVGVSIVVRGTQRGTSTNANGEFTIDANAGEVLDFSIVGYKKGSVKVGSKSNITIQMEVEVAVGSEVVVVGYATQKKANLTGAVDQVSSEILENRPINRLSQGLQGVIGNLNIVTNTNGGTPNATQNVNIRGFTGFGVSGSPLVVIDGIPTSGLSAFNNINPADIESISVLKDQASAAIYGVDGVYGVILITTKQGKKNRPPQITYNNNYSYAQLINQLQRVNSLEWAETFNEAATNAGIAKIFDDASIQRIKDYMAGTLKTETQPNATGTDWLLGNGNNDWFKVLFKDWGISQQHNVGVTGGANNSSYYIGLGYNDRKGMFRYGKDDYERYNLRANLSSDVTKWMKFTLRTAFARSLYETPFNYPGRTGGGLEAYLHQAARVWPVIPLSNPNGFLNLNNDASYMEYGGRSKDINDELQLTGEFVITPSKGWNITANYTLASYNTASSDHGKTFYIPRPDGTQATGGISPNTFSRGFSKTNNHLVNLFSSYEKNIGNHYFKVLGGYIRRFNESLSLTTGNNSLYSDRLPSLFLTYNDKPTVTDALSELTTEGYFGRINYNYKEKYLVEFNGRYDATSKFISDRWQLFPGVSAGYQVSKEQFWQPVEKYVSSLKFRASYGKSGDQSGIGSYQFYPAMGTVAPPNTNWYFNTSRQAYVSAAGVINPNITWAKPVMLDLGVDAGFLNNRLQVTYGWYKKTIKDLLVASVPLPAVFGIAAPQTNDGEMVTKGFELTATWNDKIGKNFKYNIRGTLSNYNGVITKYPNPAKLLSDWFDGERIGNIYGYTSHGLYQDTIAAGAATPASFWSSNWYPGDVRYLDLDKSGRIDNGRNTFDSSGDVRVIGNTTPQYAYSFIVDMEWKGFDLNVFLQGIGKRDAFINSNYFWGIVGNQFQSSVLTSTRDRWKPDNPNGYLPRFYMTTQNNKNTQTQTRYLQNAAYLRIKSMQIGYTLPLAVLNRLHIKKIRIYASAENLATFTKMWSGIDPELAIGTGKIYPLQRTFSFGLNMTL